MPSDSQAVARGARGGEGAPQRCEELLETASQVATTPAERGVIEGCRASISVFSGNFARSRPERVDEALEKNPLYRPLITHSILPWHDLRTRGELALYRGTVVETWDTLERRHDQFSRSPFARRFELSRIEVLWWRGRMLLAYMEARQATSRHEKQLAKVLTKLGAETTSSLAAMLAHYRRDLLEVGRVRDETAAILADEGVADPARMARVYLPGFDRCVGQIESK